MALFVTAGCARTGTGRPSQSATSGNRLLDGGDFAAFSACGKHGHSLLPGPRPHKESATPQMVILSYGNGNTSAGAMDPGRLSIRLSIAAGSGQPLTWTGRSGSRD
ncbi:hypothetical protein [Streptomyces flaveolus]|uniref:hypothetical protein n=1 Tax=Streptomyces flaveolus TaxID=67297 RepID=UPI0038150D32